MKYTSELVINKPIEEVTKQFDNPENLKKWQPGLIHFETIEGSPGMPGAKSRLIYEMGKRRIEMTETVLERKLPDSFIGTYETNGVWNKVENYFESISPGETKYTTVHEFRFSGFMKVMAFFMPLAFKKQSAEYMKLFKQFVEAS